MMLIKVSVIFFVNFLTIQVNNANADNNIQILTERPPLIHYAQPVPQLDEKDYFLENDDFVPHKYDENENFDWRLVKAVLSRKPTNTVISPFSVKLLLALLLEAAGTLTQTQQELQSIMPQLRSSALIREYYKNILNSVNEPRSEYELKVGTKIFTDYYVTVRQRYAAIIQSHYQADIDKLDFKNTAEAVSVINNWCQNATNGHIKDLIKPDDLQTAVMLLINAIYFKGEWRIPFPMNGTVDEPFFRTPSTQIRAQFMTQENYFYFLNSKTHNAKILRLPYKGKKISMYLIMPLAKGGLDELLHEFNGDALKRVQWLMHETRVKVSIPKFKFEHTSHLKDELQSLGITEIFTDSASLPGLARGAALVNNLKVSNVIQRSGIIVDESGSTAYAATVVPLENKFGGNIEDFIANRPFAFVIEDETTGAVLFAGKVTDPTM